jgi:hypothetical protein
LRMFGLRDVENFKQERIQAPWQEYIQGSTEVPVLLSSVKSRQDCGETPASQG